jgi:hypothetical protein
MSGFHGRATMPLMAAIAHARSGDNRILGLDRRTIAPSLLVLALAIVASFVLPSLDSSAPYRHPIRSGDIAALATGITLVPTPGWDLASGALVGKTRSAIGSTASTELVDGSSEVSVQAAPFKGTPSQLLTRINKINADLNHARGRDTAMTKRYLVRTRQGAVGVAENFVGVARQGSVIAFVFDMRGQQGGTFREGVEVIAAGPIEAVSRLRDDIVSMIESIRASS